MARSQGFTLIELMITLAIVAIVVTFGIPSFRSTVANNRLVSTVNQFVADSQLARSEAVKRSATVTVCRKSSGTTCATNPGSTSSDRNYGNGWLVFVNKAGVGNSNYSEADGDILLKVSDTPPATLSIYGSADDDAWIYFNSVGMPTSGTVALAFCYDQTSTTAIPGRLLSITGTGQAKTTYMANGADCTP